MRQSEWAQYFLSVIYLFAYDLPASSYIVYILGYSFVFGLFMEGLRLVQQANALGFVISLVLSLMDHNDWAHFALKVGLGLSLSLRYLFGNCDFTSYPEAPEAPFKSGFQVIRTHTFGNEVHVYYPIDKSNEITKEKDAKWLAHGDKTIKGLLMLAFNKIYGDNEEGPSKFLRHLKGLRIGAL